MVRTGKVGQQRVTIKDIAAMANVSIGTVDRVLHNRGEVNPETHHRVMSLVEGLGYTPNLLAKSLALKRFFSIAALIPDAVDNNPYWKEPLAGLNKAREELWNFNTRITVFNFDPGEELSCVRQFDRMLALNPDGIIMAPHFHDAALHFLSRCAVRNIPVILIDTDLEDENKLAYFGQDALQSGYVAARLMRYGLPDCSTVLILNLARNRVITRHMHRREQGFMEYFEKVVPENCIKTLSYEIDLFQSGEPEISLKKILEEHPDIAGIYVTNSKVHQVARCFSATGKGKILLAGYDLIKDNQAFLEQGIVDFLICQKPEEQGYRSAIAMFNFLLTGKLVEKVNYSPIDIIVKENSGCYNPLYHKDNV
jgi:LacI family transcriptional regulator